MALALRPRNSSKKNTASAVPRMNWMLMEKNMKMPVMRIEAQKRASVSTVP